MANQRALGPGFELALREVTEDDIDTFFKYLLDREANRMAAFPARDRQSFDAHLRAILANSEVQTRAILADGELAGNIARFTQDGRREVGYWLGPSFWGQGIATRALAEYLTIESTSPLYAGAAEYNAGSRRVLEKCGFELFHREQWEVDEDGEPVNGLINALSG
jgi:RimJ/RimL family protein N-acetyltransferase